MIAWCLVALTLAGLLANEGRTLHRMRESGCAALCYALAALFAGASLGLFAAVYVYA